MPATDNLPAVRPAVSAGSAKSQDAASVSVNEVQHSESDSGSPRDPAFSSLTTKTTQISKVVEVTRKTKEKLIFDLEDVTDSFFSLEEHNIYFNYINEERLMHMPRKGSKWDNVLKAAEYFGVQILAFGESISSFTLDSRAASNTALASCRLLLELGHNQAPALELTFNALYDLGNMLAKTSRLHDYFNASGSIREDLADIHSGFVDLIGNIAISYRQRISKIAKDPVVINFDKLFGKSISRLWSRKEHLSKSIWEYQLRKKQYTIGFDSIREQLCPVDQSVRTLIYARLADKRERASGSCEWIQPPLLDFFRSGDKLLTIAGKAGVGKSVLAAFMRERLQRPIGRTSYETLSYTFASDAPEELTTVALLKNFCFQLLESNVGDVTFYDQLVKAFEIHSARKSHSDLESSLWTALKAGLKFLHDNQVKVVIFIDGADELPSEDAQIALRKNVYNCVEKLSEIRAVFLSGRVVNLDKRGCRQIQVQSKWNEGDIALYFRQSLSRNVHFKEHKEQEKFTNELAGNAKGSFLWAKLVANILVKQSSLDKIVKSAGSMPAEIDVLLKDIVEDIDLNDHTTKSLLSFMLAVKRPLTVEEMTDLLRVNLDKHTLTSAIDLRKHVSATCSDIVVERKGLLRFAHSYVRKFVSKFMGKQLMSAQQADHEITLRMLLYSKFCISSGQEPSFDVLGGEALDETFRSHALIEYVVRHWAIHFQTSGMCGSGGQLSLPKNFKGLFPQSTHFSMLEWSCWQYQYSIDKTIELHDIALRVRTACFGEVHSSVMQTLIVLGTFHRSISKDVEAAKYFYRSARIGQSVLHKYSAVVVACTTLVLTITETITITTRTDIVTYREEMIKIMIEVCKAKDGPNSDTVIHWYELLIKLYVTIKEEHRTTVFYKELYEILVIRFGKGSPRARGVAKVLGDLDIVLEGEPDDEIVKYKEWIFETSDDMEITDEFRIDIIIKLARTYEASGKWFLAEKLFVNLWCRISEICRLKASVEMHIIKIDIALEYVRFLRRVKRLEEASNILICLWAEYEYSSFEREIIVVRIKEIGKLCKSFGLFSVAISIFTKIWGWFKSKGQVEHEEASSVQILMTEVIEEITETTTETRTKTTTITTETETVVREIFETTYTRCKTKGVDRHFFKSCMALINLYILKENWSEAEVVIKRSLEITWKAVLTFESKITITASYVSECVLVATQLAICYHRQKYFEKAEAIYLRIYRACLESLHIEHECVIKSSLALIHFYEEYHRHDKVIEIYVELLTRYRKTLGATHKLTIKTLYALGSLCVMLGRKEAYDYYIEIVTVLNKGSHCHHDAFEAAVILCTYYYEQKRWTELQKICHVLWETFKHHHHEYHFTAEMIQIVYERYVYVLEYHAKVEFSVLHKLTVEYRETVTKCFGISAAIVITAMIALAKICERSEKHYHESVTIYEEVITKIKTNTTITTTEVETITKTVKKRLSHVYVTIVTSGSSTTVTTIERAIAVCLEVYEHLKIELGCWHETTLTKLKELVILYKKRGTHESLSHITRLLQVSVIEILTTVTSSMILFSAAKTLASIYVSVGMVTHGQDLLHQLHHLIILHDMTYTKEITIKLNAKVPRTGFVFLVAFERCLVERVELSYSEIMIDIVVETFLYEQYTQSVKGLAKIEIILENGGKLRAFWSLRKRDNLVHGLDKKLFEIFKSKYGSYITTHENITFIFYVTLLAELSKDRSKVDFDVIVCKSSNAKVRALIEAGEFSQAHEVAKCAFQFITGPRLSIYHQRRCISYGYKLAELLAGVDVPKATDKKLREAMLETSRQILQDVLDAFRATKIDLISLKFEDLAGLVRLLGDQQNYRELIFILEPLWKSRQVHHTWSSTTVLSIGTCLVHARLNNGDLAIALDLADTICYNLRRSRGWLDPDTLSSTELLTQLHTRLGRHADAARVHEEVLREIDENDEDGNGYVDAAEKHLALLRASSGKAHTGKKEEVYESFRDLYTRLKRYNAKGGVKIPAPEKWAKEQGDAGAGQYVPIREWRLERGDGEENKTGGAVGNWNGSVDPGLVPDTHGEFAAKGRKGGAYRVASGRWSGITPARGGKLV